MVDSRENCTFDLGVKGLKKGFIISCKYSHIFFVVKLGEAEFKLTDTSEKEVTTASYEVRFFDSSQLFRTLLGGLSW